MLLRKKVGKVKMEDKNKNVIKRNPLRNGEWLNFSILYCTIKLILTFVVLSLQRLLRIFRTNTEKSLNGEVILITGSANGLGKEICRELASSGATLVLWDVVAEDNIRLAKELRDYGVRRVIEDVVDVSDRDRVKEAALKLRQNVGPVTVLVNNAGIAPLAPLFQIKAESIQKTFEVNVFSQFWTLQEFLPDMIKMKRGHIITINSILGLAGTRGSVPYTSSKHASHGLIECLKDELDHLGLSENIKFTTVYPFFIKTKLVDEKHAGLKLKFRLPWLTPFLEVEDVAKRVVEGIRQEEEIVYVPNHFDLYLRILPLMTREMHKTLLDFLIEDFEYPKANFLELKNKTGRALGTVDIALGKEASSKSF